MKEASWKDCIKNSSARSVSPDMRRAESLRETAKERIDIIPEITSKNCNFVFEDYYISLLELLHALLFKNGFNVLNHICVGYYLRDAVRREDMFAAFDDLRYKRNALTYYGNRMDYETAKHAIEKCKKLIDEIENLEKP